MDNLLTYFKQFLSINKNDNGKYEWIISNPKIFFETIPVKDFDTEAEAMKDFTETVVKVCSNEIKIEKSMLAEAVKKFNVEFDYIYKAFNKDTKEFYVCFYYTRKYENIHLNFLKGKGI